MSQYTTEVFTIQCPLTKADTQMTIKLYKEGTLNGCKFTGGHCEARYLSDDLDCVPDECTAFYRLSADW